MKIIGRFNRVTIDASRVKRAERDNRDDRDMSYGSSLIELDVTELALVGGAKRVAPPEAT